MRRTLPGGVDGNEALTVAAAVVLMVLLLAEGVTILRLDLLRGPHRVIGLLLEPPVLVTLGSTGYRFAGRYLGSRPALPREGPPPLILLVPRLVPRRS